MEKLDYLKKMYIEGKLQGEFEKQILEFESLESLKNEIKAIMKRTRDIEDIENEPLEDGKDEDKTNQNIEDYLRKMGWKIYKKRWNADPFEDWFNEWPFSRKRYHL